MPKDISWYLLMSRDKEFRFWCIGIKLRLTQPNLPDTQINIWYPLGTNSESFINHISGTSLVPTLITILSICLVPVWNFLERLFKETNDKELLRSTKLWKIPTKPTISGIFPNFLEFFHVFFFCLLLFSFADNSYLHSDESSFFKILYYISGQNIRLNSFTRNVWIK